MEFRIKCDASRAALGAVLEQLSPTGWRTVAFALLFLNSKEDRYRVIELQLIGFVSSVDYFKYH